MRLLLQIAARRTTVLDTDRRALTQLLIIGALTETADHTYRVHDGLVVNAAIVPDVLQRLLRSVAGVEAGLAVLEADPTAHAEEIGQAVKSALSADWAAGTATGVGKHLRAWAREAGVTVRAVPRAPQASGQDGLF